MHVTWDIDIDADTVEEAAQKALVIQRNPASTATVFDVTDERGETTRVDLDDSYEDQGVRVLILLEGGLVQDVLSNSSDLQIEASVLNMDLEGSDEDEIATLQGGEATLRGTMEAFDVTVSPALVEAAWQPMA